jgi:thiamine biosynthesis lipoprotein
MGVDLVNQLPGVGCIYVEDNGKMSASKKYRFKKNIK